MKGRRASSYAIGGGTSVDRSTRELTISSDNLVAICKHLQPGYEDSCPAIKADTRPFTKIYHLDMNGTQRGKSHWVS